MGKSTEFSKEWVQKIKKAAELRERFVKYNGKPWKEVYQDGRKYYRGDWAEDIIPVNRTFSFGRSLIPAVYFRSPRVTVTALRPEYVLNARVVEAVDNYLIQHTKLKKTLKMAALHAYLAGYGPIKLGYDSEFGYIPDQAVGSDMMTATQFGKSQVRNIEYNENIQPGLPWALPEKPENIIVPFNYQDPDSLPWIANILLRPLEDVKQDQKYKNTKDLQGTKTLHHLSPEKRSPFLHETGEVLAELIEVRDLSTGMIYVICEDRLLLAVDDALQIAGLPWEFVIFNDDPEYFGGIPDVCIIEPQQLELNEIRTQASRHRKIALLKFLFQKGVMTEEELTKFFSGEVGPGIEVDTDMLSSAVQLLQPHVPTDLQAEAQVVKGDMRESIGMSENQAGAFTPYHNKTAAETLQVAGAFEERTNERRDIMADVLRSIITKWNKYIFQFWTGERVVQIAGPNGAPLWVKYTGEQIKGEYALRIDPDTGFPATKALRQQAADILMRTYGGDPLIDQVRLRELHLEQFEWLYPGVTSLVAQQDPEVASALGQERQPGPAFGGGSLGRPQGGRQGESPENAINFEQAKKKFEENK